MAANDRRFRNEPERIEAESDLGTATESRRDEAWLPETNAARASLASRTRASRGAALDGRAQGAAARAGFGSTSGVRVHTGPAAASAASSIGARAFTVGQDVYFGAGEYAPGTPAGDELLGHELAHTAQQRDATPAVAAKMETSTPGDAMEVEADRAGSVYARAARGEEVAQASVSPTGQQTVARDVVGSHTAADEAATEKPLLDERKRAAAAAFNGGRHLPATAWEKIRRIVGVDVSGSTGDIAEAVAHFQERNGFDVDGRVGDTTLQRLSQQGGGAGLEDLVKNDNVVYLGFNPASRGLESDTLKTSAGADKVTALTGGKQQDHAIVGGKSVDLTTDAGLDAMLASMPKLDAGTRTKVKGFLETSGSSAKDEMAQLVRVLYEAQYGERLMKRFVLSGHSGGWSVWGDDNGMLDFDHMTKLQTIFPGAMGQVEDLMLSACNTGFAANVPKYLSIFPNLKSMWAYVGYSPSAATGSTRHVKEWEKSTRGTMNSGTVNAGRERISAGHGERDHNVAVWTRESGTATPRYESDSPYLANDYASLRATVDSGLSHYEDAYTGGTINQSALDELYVQLQSLVGNHASELGAEQARYELIMKKVLYLRHWSNISGRFMAEHGDTVKAAYSSAGVAMPAFGTMTRAQALAKIQSFPGDKSSEAFKLLAGILRDLDPTKIPDNWV